MSRDLYGEEVTLNSIYFPVHISKLVNNMPPSFLINEKDIIEKNTLYKVFTSFLDDDRKNNIYEGMLNRQKFNAFQPLGLVGSKVLMKDKLYFCEECMKEDLESYGESYWRVIHQVPGVYYCTKHERVLNYSNVLSSNSRVSYKILNENISAKEVNLNYDFMNINLKYVRMIEELYSSNFDSKNKEFFDALYIDRLRDRGYASKNGSIKLVELEEAFIDFYTQEYLILMQSYIEVGNSWLRRFIRTSKKQKHVLRHLLMIQFLGLNIEQVFNTKKVKGKEEYIYIPNPRLDREVQREKWLQVLKDNPGLNKSQYKKIGKGLYSWLYKNDNEWFEKITPKNSSLK